MKHLSEFAIGLLVCAAPPAIWFYVVAPIFFRDPRSGSSLTTFFCLFFAGIFAWLFLAFSQPGES